MLEKARDNERYVLLTQMDHFGLLDETSAELAIIEKKAITEKYQDFFSEGMSSLRVRLSKGLRNRMNNIYRKTIEAAMSEKDKAKILRYVYHILEHEEEPAKVLTVKLEI